MKHCTSSVVKRYIISSGKKIESKCFYNCKLSKRMLIIPLKQAWSHFGRHATKFFFILIITTFRMLAICGRSKAKENRTPETWSVTSERIFSMWSEPVRMLTAQTSRILILDITDWDLEALWPMNEGEYTDRDKSFLNVELSQRQSAKVNLKQELRKRFDSISCHHWQLWTCFNLDN